jgi:hypothetical protein
MPEILFRNDFGAAFAYCALPALAAASMVPSSGVTFWPGRARCKPSMTILSVGASPDRITRSPSTIGPVSTSFIPTVPSSPTVNMILRD